MRERERERERERAAKWETAKSDLFRNNQLFVKCETAKGVIGRGEIGTGEMGKGVSGCPLSSHFRSHKFNECHEALSCAISTP